MRDLGAMIAHDEPLPHPPKDKRNSDTPFDALDRSLAEF
jgi:hypothetical protein